MEIRVLKHFINMSIYDFLVSFHLSKATIKSLELNKRVFLNNEYICDFHYKLKENDMLIINFSEKQNIIPYNYRINILYEDDFVIAVNKPANILIHSDGNTYETLTNAVYNHVRKTNKEAFVYPVHRIDYETTGIVLFSKNKLALSYLSVEIEKHNVLKQYVCLCHGKFRNKEGQIKLPISKDRHSNRQIINENGKEAKSNYKVLEHKNNISKVQVEIEHGRKHQIRVHLSALNHPIVGDKVYGKSDGELKLHFKKMSFIHPYTQEKIIIECEEEF